MRPLLKALLCFCLGYLNGTPLALAESPVVCTMPRLPPHLRTNALSTSQENAIASFWCDNGYTLVGSATSSCTAQAQWHPPTPSCQADTFNTTCEFPLRNPFIVHNVTTFPVLPGTVAAYSCDAGFVLIGPMMRLCASDGNWTSSDPICAAKVSDNRRVAAVSQNVDFTTNPGMRGAAILDGNQYQCSIADATNRVAESFWKIDLLEKLTVDFVVLIFQFRIDITINLLSSWNENDPNPTRLTEQDYLLTNWSGNVDGEEVTTYEYRLTTSGQLRYLTIQIPKTSFSPIYLCEVMVLSKKASASSQCWNTRDLWNKANTMTVGNGTCFSIIRSVHDTWSKGYSVCSAINNGKLATHVSLDQQRLLTAHLVAVNTTNTDRFWIGGHANVGSKGREEWMWEDDTAIKEFYWGIGQPSMTTGFKPCISLNKNLRWSWDDQPCDNHYNYICEHDILSCGQPDVPANTFVEGERLGYFYPITLVSSIGTKINYTCPDDYELDGARERVCKNGGKWSGKAPYCWKKGATKPTEPPAKQVAKTGLPIGAIVAIIAGIILGILLIVAIILFVVYKKKRGGTSMMKYTSKTESAETLDVDEKKGGKGTKTNYASTSER